MSSAPGASVTPDIIPDKPQDTGWKLTKVYSTSNPGVFTYSVDKPTWARVTVVGKSGNGTSGTDSSDAARTRAGNGGAGGASGGIARKSILLMPNEPVTVTINSSLVSFGEHLTATAAGTQGSVGTVSGGEDFNINGNAGGYGGNGSAESIYTG